MPSGAASQERGERFDEPRRQLALLAEMLGVPMELRVFVTAVDSCGAITAPEKLRIRAVHRPRPPRPIRRGAKVTVEEVKSGTRAVTLGAKRGRDGDGADGSSKRPRGEEEDEGLVPADDGDDEISVGFAAEDDDDNAVMDDAGGGSDDGGDFF